MQCHNCQSDNVQKLSVVYEQGTQNIKTRGRTYGSGVGFGHRGLMGGFGSATTTTTGKSQSIAAKKAAPPVKRPIIAAIGVIALGLLVLLVLHATMFGLVLLAAGGLLFWNFNQYNRQTFPPLYAAWEKSWLCNKCGTVSVQ